MKLLEIQYARAFAMVTVLFVHFSSNGLIGSPLDSPMSHAYGLANSIGRLGVPVFFLLSGLVLFYTTNKRPFNLDTIKTFYKKRIQFIIIPYITVSLGYFVFTWVVYYNYSLLEGMQLFIKQLFTGQTHMHLYFLFILIQFYFIFPILYYVYKKSRLSVGALLVISLIVQFGWVYLNKHYFEVSNRSIVFLTYFSFFAFGGALGLHYEKVRQALSKVTFKFVSIGTFVIAVSLMYIYDRTARTGIMYSYITDGSVISTLFDVLWTLLGISAAICFLVIGKWIVDRQFVRTGKFLNRIADLSFGIYLIHPFFLIIFMELQPANTPLVFHSWQIITAVGVTALSWLATVIISKNKFGWIFIGK